MILVQESLSLMLCLSPVQDQWRVASVWKEVSLRQHGDQLFCLPYGLFSLLVWSLKDFVCTILICSKGVSTWRESNGGYTTFLKVHCQRHLAENLLILTAEQKVKELQRQEGWAVPWCVKDEQAVFLRTSPATSQLGSSHYKDQTRKQSKASFDQNVPTPISFHKLRNLCSHSQASLVGIIAHQREIVPGTWKLSVLQHIPLDWVHFVLIQVKGILLVWLRKEGSVVTSGECQGKPTDSIPLSPDWVPQAIN